jgi:hypothetical protein
MKYIRFHGMQTHDIFRGAEGYIPDMEQGVTREFK